MPQLRLLHGEPIEFTSEALEHGAQGVVVAKCAIDEQGDVRDCAIEKEVPYMSRAVVVALEKRQYEPIVIEGRAVRVEMTFHVRLMLPEETPEPNERADGERHPGPLHSTAPESPPDEAAATQAVADAVRARLQLASGSPAKRQPESSALSVPPVTRSVAASRPAAAWHVDLDEGASCDVRLDYLESGCSLLIGIRQTGWRTAGSAERRRASCGDVTPTCAGPVTCRCGGEGRQRAR